MRIITSGEDMSILVNRISVNNPLTDLCVDVLQQPTLVESVGVMPVCPFIFFKVVVLIIQIWVVVVEILVLMLDCVFIE